MEKEKLIILGTGPAGLTAAIYAARANLNPLVVSGSQPGGQLTITTEVENFPGFPKGVMGPELMELFRGQAERFGTRFIQGDVKSVSLSERPFLVEFADGKKVLCETLIIATGATAKLMGLPSEKKLMGKGVSACATCDGFFFKNQHVGVVGGGDTALEEATFLTKFASKVTLIHRRDQLRASKFMQDRAKKNPKIEFIWNSAVINIIGDRDVQAVELEDTQTHQKKILPLQGLFVAIGHQPNTVLFKDHLKMNESGYLVVNPGTTRTNIPGVFAAGDVADPHYRQAVTAAGTGCMAALDAERFLEKSENEA